MTWEIERGVYEAHPITRTPHEVSRIWRFHPPPWKLILSTPDHELAKTIIDAHNEDVTAAGETPQLGLLPRRTVARALRRLVGLHVEQFSEMERGWIEHHIHWLENEERPVPTHDRPQRQDSLTDQLRDLVPVANRLGCYDAADFVKSAIERHNDDT